MRNDSTPIAITIGRKGKGTGCGKRTKPKGWYVPSGRKWEKKLRRIMRKEALQQPWQRP